MLSSWRKFLFLAFIFSLSLAAQETHNHPAPEKLGTVSFQVSCSPSVQSQFNRAVALLHSFAYAAAEDAFRAIIKKDPTCGMAHWGVSMAGFHQLWEPPVSPDSLATANQEIAKALSLGAGSDREKRFMQAARLIFHDAAAVPYPVRIGNYEASMAQLAAKNPIDVESQVFYALSLLAAAPPSDSSHARQKKAIEILRPLYRKYPEHPGIAHYLIHACDNIELANQGLSAARAYSKIAPSAPHALHMPSHIFTRLGLWDDSVKSNQAARAAARAQGDVGEELHAMDYLVYAYLQNGKEIDAAQILQQLTGMTTLNKADFKIGYAATAMPIRFLVEQNKWNEAASVIPPSNAPPHVVALAVWAQGLGLTRSQAKRNANQQITRLQKLEDQLRNSGNNYWAIQVGVMKQEIMAWQAQAANKPTEAAMLLRKAAEEEDSVEKLPVTPGPIIPAREQLGELLLEQGNARQAAKEFQVALASSPARRRAQRKAVEASRQAREESK